MNKIDWCFKHLIAPMGAGILTTLAITDARGEPLTTITLVIGVAIGFALIIASLMFFSFKGKED
ncbi:MAG: hypothetical protein V4644_00390 [Patescibacteria group bacterium]